MFVLDDELSTFADRGLRDRVERLIESCGGGWLLPEIDQNNYPQPLYCLMTATEIHHFRNSIEILLSVSHSFLSTK